MAEFIHVTEESLRAAMRDPRYWRSGHPEREEYNRWVTEGWRAVVNEGQGKGGVVQVRAYTRTRNGKTEQVGHIPGLIRPAVMTTKLRPRERQRLREAMRMLFR
ncbi:hypothetical protein [Sediminicoccus rosea]|uniref:Uncharacterized protein n=1 Tax=Sediminicoccus rosea TaxID=1225128 RepID=A0ABZ0PMC2_9PROT|nr:hypothetical protein [Sediminicoccus rosea]WPB86376.1 hypothetical protein R9Z33_05760 [Sediminicoccus rosea]